uniref:SH2 domain-containing protein n=1 Tax=Parastrongyloides trichosuri TaxID=131310 RepID=A0A0N4Z0C8_PARTI
MSGLTRKSNFSLKNKMEIAHPVKLMKKRDELMYYRRKENSVSNSSLSENSLRCSPLEYKDTIYLGVSNIDEALPKTGYGHFYLYHCYDGSKIKDIKDLDQSLQLYALIKTSPNVGLHCKIVRRRVKDNNGVKELYALGTFEDNKAFSSVDELADYYRHRDPNKILIDKGKFFKDHLVKETKLESEYMNISGEPSTDASLMIAAEMENGRQGLSKRRSRCDSSTNSSESDKVLKNYASSYRRNRKSSKDNYERNKKDSVKAVDSEKWNYIKSLRNKKCSEDELGSASYSRSTSLPTTTEPSTTEIEKIIPKSKKVERDDKFYNRHYLGTRRKKEIKDYILNSFDFAFYHRSFKKKPGKKAKKERMYMVYKPLNDGALIHLPITRTRNPEYDGSETSVKRFFDLKTPYGNYDRFNNFKDMVDHYYNRIEEVKKLYKLFSK